MNEKKSHHKEPTNKTEVKMSGTELRLPGS